MSLYNMNSGSQLLKSPTHSTGLQRVYLLTVVIVYDDDITQIGHIDTQTNLQFVTCTIL